MLQSNNNSSANNMKVIVRVRPLNRNEMEQNQRNIISVTDSSSLIFDPEEDEDEFFFHGNKQTHRDITKRVRKKLLMDFDYVFDDQSVNFDIFENCTKPLIQSVMDGFSCSVFVYGATGAGKTHTMLGNNDELGITFMTMEQLFLQMNLLQNERKFDIGISYLEVYNEHVMNLLTKTGPLRLREDGHGGVVVQGLILKEIVNANELIDLLVLGNQNRTQHPTDANAESSRSHAIFQVHIRMTNKQTGVKNTVKLSMIDLAGSERAASTKGIGERFKEGASINKSLLALGNCINKLADGSKHIPYRDSNLTRIIKDCLGGNCKTVMIANVSPSSLTYDDTYNTLKYAGRARKIKTTLSINVVKSNVPKEILVKQLTNKSEEVAKLKATIDELNRKLCASENKDPEEIDLSLWHKEIDTVFDAIKTAIDYIYNLNSKEKLLKLKTKLKDDAEGCNRLLTLNEKSANSRVDASIDRLSKQIQAQQDETKRWMERLQYHKQQLVNLHQKIKESRVSYLLEPYIRGKQIEIENVKLRLKVSHLLTVGSLYMCEVEHANRILTVSNSFNRDCRLVMSANNILHPDMQEKYEKLIKLNQRQNSVKFDKTTDADDVLSQFVIPLYENNSPKQSRKRTNTKEATEFRQPRKLFKVQTADAMLLEPPKPINLNETCVLSSASNDDVFALPIVNGKSAKVVKPGLKNTNKENMSTYRAPIKARIVGKLPPTLKMKSPKRSPRLLSNNARKPYDQKPPTLKMKPK